MSALIFTASSSFCMISAMRFTSRIRSSRLMSSCSARYLYSVGYRYFMDKSSSSLLICAIPSLAAMGAYISSVSRAIRSCFSGFKASKVRILCNLSASFMNKTRKSFEMAKKSFLRFSACASICVVNLDFNFESFVTASTKTAISSPNFFLSVSLSQEVSSTTSCKSAAQMHGTSIPRSTSISAAAIGCST